jgi:hypothetical protein
MKLATSRVLLVFAFCQILAFMPMASAGQYDEFINKLRGPITQYIAQFRIDSNSPILAILNRINADIANWETINPVVKPSVMWNIAWLLNKLKTFDEASGLFQAISAPFEELESTFFLQQQNPQIALQGRALAFFGDRFKIAPDTLAFSPKNGDQLGNIIRFMIDGQTVRFYVKTHRSGLRSGSSSAARRVDPYELFVYSFLEASGLGPEVHFFGDDPQNFYIATRDIGYSGTPWPFTVLTRGQLQDWLQALSNGSFFQRADHIVRVSFAPMIASALIQAEVIAHIFGLTDLVTNSGNICFMRDDAIGALVGYRIVDFAPITGYWRTGNRPDIFPLFVQGIGIGIGNVSYEGDENDLVRCFLGQADRGRRIFVARCLFSKRFVQSISEAEERVRQLIVELHSTEGDLRDKEQRRFQQAVLWVKANAAAFYRGLCEAFCQNFPDLDERQFSPIEFPEAWDTQPEAPEPEEGTRAFVLGTQSPPLPGKGGGYPSPSVIPGAFPSPRVVGFSPTSPLKSRIVLKKEGAPQEGEATPRLDRRRKPGGYSPSRSTDSDDS